MTGIRSRLMVMELRSEKSNSIGRSVWQSFAYQRWLKTVKVRTTITKAPIVVFLAP